MADRSLALDDQLHAYLVDHSSPLDEVARELAAETRALLPAQAGMQVAPEQAGFLTMLTRISGARLAVEVGTFTGMSSLAIARGLPADGQLICFDISADYTAVAQRYWRRAGVADRIELRLGQAADRLRELPAGPHLDLAFIDADKPSYRTYWTELVPRIRPGGLIVVDNVLWHGRVLEPAPDDPNTVAIKQFNDEVAADDRVVQVMLPVADGLTLAYRR
jgi:caffeoyl-CoA O-methyltransferase